MYVVERRIDIESSPQKIWAHLWDRAKLAAMMTHYTYLSKIEYSVEDVPDAPPLGPGHKFLVKSSRGPSQTVVITDWKQFQRATYVIEDKRSVLSELRVEATLELTPKNSLTTEFHTMFQLEFTGRWSKLLAMTIPLQGVCERGQDAFLERLKKALES